MWHADVTIGDLHYLRTKFAIQQGHENIVLNSFVRATEEIYYSGQFRVNGDYFLTWALLEPQWEVNYVAGHMAWIEHCHKGNAWIVEAYMPNMAISAFKQLKHLIPNNAIRFNTGGKIRKISLI